MDGEHKRELDIAKHGRLCAAQRAQDRIWRERPWDGTAETMDDFEVCVCGVTRREHDDARHEFVAVTGARVSDVVGV